MPASVAYASVYMFGACMIAIELNYRADYIKRKHAEIMKRIKFVSTV